MLENVIDTIENCRYCLMCRHVAPVGIVTYQEALTPHGVALVAASQRRGMIDWDAESVGIIFSEVDGGNSRMHCVNDQPFEDAIAAIRAELVELQLAPPIVYEIQRKINDWGNPFAEVPLTKPNSTGDTAVYISGECLHFGEMQVESVKTLLNAIGIDPVVFGGFGNGFLANSLGLVEQAKQQAQQMISQLEASGARQLIVLTPGDYYTLTQLYDERLGIAFPEGVEVIELTTLLANALMDGDLEVNGMETDAVYAYVDPTHAVRVPTRHTAPRRLLTRLIGGKLKELFWRRERSHPVGNTALQFTQPELAEKLTRARLADAQASGADVIVTDDPATLYQLGRFADDFKLSVVGLYVLLATHSATR